MLSPAERMTVLADEWALVRAGRHDVGTFLDLASGFRDERTASVMSTLTGLLATIGDEFTTDATRDGYRAWLGKFIAPALADVGLPGRPADDDEAKSLRASVVGLAGGTARASGGAGEGADAGPAGARQRRLGRADAAGRADQPRRSRRRCRALRPLSREEQGRDRPRRALSVSLRADVLRQSGAGAPDHGADPVGRGPLPGREERVARMLANSDTQRLAWQLVRERWAGIQKKTGEFVGNTIIVGALASFCDTGTAAEIQTFFSTHKVPDAERTLQQSLERITACARTASRAGAEAGGLVEGAETNPKLQIPARTTTPRPNAPTQLTALGPVQQLLGFGIWIW